MTKIYMSRVILEAMIFLNIPTESFHTLKKQYGGLNQLHEHIYSLLH